MSDFSLIYFSDSGDIKTLIRFPGNSDLKFLLRIGNCVGCVYMRRCCWYAELVKKFSIFFLGTVRLNGHWVYLHLTVKF